MKAAQTPIGPLVFVCVTLNCHVFSLKVNFSMSCYRDLTFCDFLIKIINFSQFEAFVSLPVLQQIKVTWGGSYGSFKKKFNTVENSDIKDFWKKRDKTNNNQY